MPIHAGKITIVAQKVAANPATPKPVDAPAPKPIERTAPPPEPVVQNTDNEPVLIVNGKQRKVSMRSAYLLDMLTTDDQ
jgi:hypothetical protein